MSTFKRKQGIGEKFYTKMYVHRVNNGKRESQYTCSQYPKVPVGKLCKSQHRIKEAVVLTFISDMLKAIADYTNQDREEFVNLIKETQNSQQQEDIKKAKTRLVSEQTKNKRNIT